MIPPSAGRPVQSAGPNDTEAATGRPGRFGPLPDESLDALVTVLDEIRFGRSRSRSELVARTELGRAIVAQRVGELIERGLVTEGDLIMKDIRLEYPTYIHLLDGFIMYPPAITKFEHELKKAVAAQVVDVMTSQPFTVQASSPVEDVATVLVERDVSRVPVLDGDELVGIITKSDVVRSMFGGREK